MSEHVCKICGTDIEAQGGYQGALFLPHLEPGAVVKTGVDICTKCIAAIITTTLCGSPSPGAYNARSILWNTCWLCGGYEEIVGFLRLPSGREVRTCRKCERVMRDEGRRLAGVPVDWEEHPRRCNTCLHERKATCRYLPPVVLMTPEGDEFSYQPEVATGINSTDGCDSCWRPKLVPKGEHEDAT